MPQKVITPSLFIDRLARKGPPVKIAVGESKCGPQGFVLVTWLFWRLAIAGIVAAVRYTGRGGQTGATTAPQGPTQSRVLAERLACDEIEDEQYRGRLQVIGD
jgi:uncharacterized membrane protein